MSRVKYGHIQKMALSLGGNQLNHRGFLDITQIVVWFHKVIAGVEPLQ
jgi:hypothetical protein